MKTKNETDLLNELIITIEKKRIHQLELLKEQLHEACESLKPLNLIKTAFHEVTDSPDIKNNLVADAIGFGTGFLSKKLLMGNSNNPIRKGLGTLVQFGITNLISKHSDDIKSITRNLLSRFLNQTKQKG